MAKKIAIISNFRSWRFSSIFFDSSTFKPSPAGRNEMHFLAIVHHVTFHENTACTCFQARSFSGVSEVSLRVNISSYPVPTAVVQFLLAQGIGVRKVRHKYPYALRDEFLEGFFSWRYFFSYANAQNAKGSFFFRIFLIHTLFNYHSHFRIIFQLPQILTIFSTNKTKWNISECYISDIFPEILQTQSIINTLKFIKMF